MPQLPLKSHTGCATCRRRRKKCDESKPACGPCRRLGLNCVWRTPEAKPRADTSGTTNLSELVGGGYEESGAVRRASALLPRGSSGYQPFSSQVLFDLVIQSPQHLSLLISRSASEEFRDTSITVTLSLQNAWARPAIAAFSALNLAAQSAHPRELERLGMDMYQGALVDLRDHIKASPFGSATVEVLTAVTFLGLFESLGTGDQRIAVQHFTAALWLSQQMEIPRSQTPLVFYRIAVECWLFNLSTLSIYHYIPDGVVERIDWTIVDKTFDGPFQSHHLTVHTSPFLGGMHVIYKIMLQVTWFARQQLPTTVRSRQTSRWSQELNLITDGLESSYSPVPSDDVASLYYWKCVLHVYAIQIFLVKIADPQSSTSSPVIRRILEHARRVFKQKTTSESRNPSLAWPLVIFLCACHEESVFQFFVTTIEVIRDNFDPGHKKRLHAVLEMLRSERLKQRHDTLDLLLAERGILGD